VGAQEAERRRLRLVRVEEELEKMESSFESKVSEIKRYWKRMEQSAADEKRQMLERWAEERRQLEAEREAMKQEVAQESEGRRRDLEARLAEIQSAADKAAFDHERKVEQMRKQAKLVLEQATAEHDREMRKAWSEGKPTAGKKSKKEGERNAKLQTALEQSEEARRMLMGEQEALHQHFNDVAAAASENEERLNAALASAEEQIERMRRRIASDAFQRAQSRARELLFAKRLAKAQEGEVSAKEELEIVRRSSSAALVALPHGDGLSDEMLYGSLSGSLSAPTHGSPTLDDDGDFLGKTHAARRHVHSEAAAMRPSPSCSASHRSALGAHSAAGTSPPGYRSLNVHVGVGHRPPSATTTHSQPPTPGGPATRGKADDGAYLRKELLTEKSRADQAATRLLEAEYTLLETEREHEQTIKELTEELRAKEADIDMFKRDLQMAKRQRDLERQGRTKAEETLQGTLRTGGRVVQALNMAKSSSNGAAG